MERCSASTLHEMMMMKVMWMGIVMMTVKVGPEFG